MFGKVLNEGHGNQEEDEGIYSGDISDVVSYFPRENQGLNLEYCLES